MTHLKLLKKHMKASQDLYDRLINIEDGASIDDLVKISELKHIEENVQRRLEYQISEEKNKNNEE